MQLFRNADLSLDTLLVMLTPLRYAATPQSAQDIEHRMQELAFNATFLREMRMFAHLRERIARIGWWRRGPLERRLAGGRAGSGWTRTGQPSAATALSNLPGCLVDRGPALPRIGGRIAQAGCPSPEKHP